MTADAEFVAALLRRRAEDYLAALTEAELADRLAATEDEPEPSGNTAPTNPREDN